MAKCGSFNNRTGFNSVEFRLNCPNAMRMQFDGLIAGTQPSIDRRDKVERLIVNPSTFELIQYSVILRVSP